MTSTSEYLRAGCVLLALATAGCAVPLTQWQAEQAYKKEKYDVALQRFEALAHAQPDERKWKAAVEESRRRAALAYVREGRRYHERGNLDAAVARYDRALDVYADHPMATRYRREATRTKLEVWGTHLRASRRRQAGDCVQALDLYRPIRRYAATFPAIGEEARRAAVDCARRWRKRGEVQMKVGAFEQARDSLQHAAELTPRDTRIATLLEGADKLSRARALTTQARNELDSGDWEGSLASFEKAAAIAPEYRPATLGAAEAKRVGTVGYLAAGSTALERGDYVSALRQLKAGRKLADGQPELVEKLDARALAASRRLAAAYVARARKLRRRKLPGAALVYARLGRSLASDFAPAAAEERACLNAARSQLAYRIGVAPLANPNGAPGAGAQLSQAIADGLERSLGKGDVRIVRAGRANALLTGQVFELSIRAESPRTESRQITYTAGEVVKTNPALGPAMKTVGDYKMKVWTVGPKVKEAKAKQEQLVQKEQKAVETVNDLVMRINSDNAQRANQGQPLLQHPNHPLSPQLTAARQQYERIKQERHVHETQVLSPLETELNGAKLGLSVAELALSNTPPTIKEPVSRTHRYQEILATIRGTARIEVVIEDQLTQQALARTTAEATVERTDSAHAGFPPAGLSEDPMSLASEDAVRRELVRALVQTAVEQLAPSVRSNADRYVTLSERATGDVGLHYRVLALLAGAGNRDVLVRRIRDEHGLRWDRGSARLKSLPSP